MISMVNSLRVKYVIDIKFGLITYNRKLHIIMSQTNILQT